MQNNVSELKYCLACDSGNLLPVLDLGTQPLANSFKEKLCDKEEKYPLAINVCRNCHHVQLTHAVNPELMFKEYLYVSGTSKTMADHFKWFAEYAKEYFTFTTVLRPQSVLDIGCNDGSQLNAFKALGLKTFGVDPAENLYATSSINHTVYKQFFNQPFVETEGGAYDLLVAQNVFAHNADPLSFLKYARLLMHDDSLMFVQTSQADMIKNGEFDTIYHEHINFFNVKSMNELTKRAALYMIDVIKCPIHGNSYIFVLSKNKSHKRPYNISNQIAMEKAAGLYDDKTYGEYGLRCKDLIEKIKFAVDPYRRLELGWNIVGYGAAAKGMTVLNATGLKLDAIVDDNPLKQGRFAPGSNIPIVPIDYIKEHKDTTLFVPLAWNFYDEIVSKIKAARPTNEHDMYLKYFPEAEVYHE